jgi:hypothetical protein
MNNFSKLIVEGAVILTLGIGVPSLATAQANEPKISAGSLNMELNKNAKTAKIQDSRGNAIMVIKQDSTVTVGTMLGPRLATVTYDKPLGTFTARIAYPKDIKANPNDIKNEIRIIGRNGSAISYNGESGLTKNQADTLYRLIIRGNSEVFGIIAKDTASTIIRNGIAMDEVWNIFTILAVEATRCLPGFQKAIEPAQKKKPIKPNAPQKKNEPLNFKAPANTKEPQTFNKEPPCNSRNYAEAARKISNQLAAVRQPMQHARGQVRIRGQI